MLRRAGLALLLVFGAHSASADDLLRPGDTITGKLRFFQHQHPNGTWIPVYQITSDHPRKLAEKDEFCGDEAPATFHLVVMNDKSKKHALANYWASASVWCWTAFSARRRRGTSATPSPSNGICRGADQRTAWPTVSRRMTT